MAHERTMFLRLGWSDVAPPEDPSRSGDRVGSGGGGYQPPGKLPNTFGETRGDRRLGPSCSRGTVAYPPDTDLPDLPAGQFVTEITVENDSTLAVARRLIDQDYDTVVLNFASATHPGGGFLHGARAQEEYLTRSSTLYECLVQQPMYDWHARHGDPLYSDYALYSPRVPVFRGRSGQLLEEPYCVGVITCAAVNASRLPTERRGEIEPAMRSRIERVLAIGRLHQHDAIVLGAWGGARLWQRRPTHRTAVR